MVETLLTDYDRLLRRAVADAGVAAEAAKVPDPSAKWVLGGGHAVHRPLPALAMAYFDPLSERAGEPALWDRLDALTGLFGRFQHADGLIDLHASNFHSPPDAAFMVADLVPLHEVLRETVKASPERDAVLGRLEPVIVAACEAMSRGGVHTPNHRWKLASALLLADAVWPHDAWRAEAQAYLDEGIDIDADGEFTERSTGCYNETCNRSLILMGRTLRRADLLACADRNLEHMLDLLHADGTLVTSYSRRQDRRTTVGVERHLLTYWYRAMTAGNGRFLSAAALGLERIDRAGGRIGHLATWLRYLREAAEAAPPEPVQLPAACDARFEGAGVVRRRRGELSLTLMARWDDFLSVRFGAGPDVTVRLAAGFAPRGQFLADEVAGADGRYRLRSHHACEYYGPGPDPLPAGDWRERASFARRVFVGAELTLQVDVEHVGDGLRLRLSSDGCPRVPLELAFTIRDAESVTPSRAAESDQAAGKSFLNGGELVLRGPGHVVRIGPGAAEHGLTRIPTADADAPPGAWCIRLATPVEATIGITAEAAR